MFGSSNSSSGSSLFGGFSSQQPLTSTSGALVPVTQPTPTSNPFGGSNLFGGTTTFGQQPQQQSSSLFGSTASSAPTTSFGTTGNIFGTTASSSSTTNPFSTATSIFAQPQQPQQQSSSLFGTNTAPPTPSSTLFGQPQQQSTTSIFGSSPFGQNQQSTSLFSSAPSTTTVTGLLPTGTGSPPFTTTTDTEGASSTILHSITAMSAYRQKSFEELRLEDYSKGRKAPGYGPPSTPSTASPFGTQLPTNTSSSLFGATQQQQQPFTSFGSQPSTTIAAPTSTSFGSTIPTAANTIPFGSTTSASASFSNTTTTASSIFGQQSSNVFSKPSTLSFGTQPASSTAAPSTGLFGQSQQPSTLFGTTAGQTQPSTLFSQTQPSLATSGLFGSSTATTPAPSITTQSITQPQVPSTQPLFNSNTTFPSFGTSVSKPTASFFSTPSTTTQPTTTTTPATFSFIPSSSALGTGATPFTQPWTTNSNATGPVTATIKDKSSYGHHPWLDAPAVLSTTPSTIRIVPPPTTDTLEITSRYTTTYQPVSQSIFEPIQQTFGAPLKGLTVKKSVKKLVIQPEHYKIPPIYPETKHAIIPAEIDRDDISTNVERLPYGFTISPSIQYIIQKGLKNIHQLMIARRGYGAVIFDNHVHLDSILTYSEKSKLLPSSFSIIRQIFLKRLVGIDEEYDTLNTENCIIVFERKSITVYPHEDEEESEGEWRMKKPDIGTGLNVPATIQLEGCFPIANDERKVDQVHSEAVVQAFITRLENIPDTRFIDYIQESGTWIFHVDHFSRYECDIQDLDKRDMDNWIPYEQHCFAQNVSKYI